MLNIPAREIVHPAKLLAGVQVVRKGREPDLGTVGGRIKYARVTKGLTQDQLAEKIGVSKSAISQWEGGRIENLTSANLLSMAAQLEASPEWIWYGKDKQGQQIPMGRPVHLVAEESDLVETFKLLEPGFRDALLGDAHKYLKLSASQQPSRANPYPKAKATKK